MPRRSPRRSWTRGLRGHLRPACHHGAPVRGAPVEPSDAEGLLGEVFRIAFEQRATFDLGRESARPWLYGIATNLVARHRRSEGRRIRAVALLASRPGCCTPPRTCSWAIAATRPSTWRGTAGTSPSVAPGRGEPGRHHGEAGECGDDRSGHPASGPNASTAPTAPEPATVRPGARAVPKVVAVAADGTVKVGSLLPEPRPPLHHGSPSAPAAVPLWAPG